MNNKLKYLGYSVVFQEVPDEVTLAINISGCPHRCEGCHSKYLWEYRGNYISNDLEELVQKYDGLITCVCFMGGEHNPSELVELLSKVHRHKLKTALYTGEEHLQRLDFGVVCNLDYCKVGHYDNSLGGLDNKNTNQRMFMWNYNTRKWEDITYKFWKEDKTSDSNNNKPK